MAGWGVPAAFGAAVGLAVFCLLVALRSGGGSGVWGGGRAGRLESLLRPVRRLAVTPRTGGFPGGAGPGAAARWLGPGPRGGGSPRTAGWPTVVLWGLGGGAAGLVSLGSPVGAVLGGSASVWAYFLRRGAGEQTRMRSFQDGLEATLETMVASLKAGLGVAQALEQAARAGREPVRAALLRVLDLYRAGARLGDALETMTTEWPLPEVRYFAACLATHLRTGGDVTALLVNLGGLLRERRYLERELTARTNEARSTATVLALLPPGLLGYILWAGPTQLESLVSCRVGLLSAGLAAAGWAAGVVVLRRLLGGIRRQIKGGG
ncbi:MAG: type II secretion system F family protein [Bacillota bacterium]